MTSKNTLIIGTRGSALALAQADMVCAALSLRYPELDVRREIIHTIGDRRTDVPLADVARVSGMVDKGIFIKELETALRDGRIDVAVHSLKDVPSELASGFTLAAVLPRAAVEDVLITKEPDWNGSGTLATGSVRRRLMARTYWGSGLRFENLRGNVPTRLGKLVEQPGWDAVILARAGLERLGLYAPETLVEGRKLYMRSLPVEVFIPAVGQGIVGMECRSSDRETEEMLKGINDPEAFACALAERAFLVRLGANCSTPVGVYAHLDGEELVLRAAYYAPGREEPFAVVVRGDRKAPEALGWGLYAPETLVEGRKLYMRSLPVEVFIPAVGQGIVGMECRSSDRETEEMLKGINDPEAFACALAERAFLVRLGANCSTPVGVYAHLDGEELVLRAAYYAPGREEPFAVVVRGDRKAPEALGLRAFEELGLR